MKYRWLIGLIALGICAGAVLGIGVLSGDREVPVAVEPEKAAAEGEACPAGHEKPKPLVFTQLNLRRAFAYDPATGKKGRITYTLEQPGLVSIRVKKTGTRELFLATIVDWEYRDAGTHTENWDGRDYSGNLVEWKEATLMVFGEAASSEPGTMESAAGLSDEEIIHGHKWGHVHAKHHEYAEEVPILTIISIAEGDTLRGKALVRAEVDEDKRGYGDEWGYGVRYYVDDMLAREEFYRPESNGKFAYELDTTPFEDGEHTLYVGMCDHNQHATSRGVKVVFDNFSLGKW